MSQRWTIGIAVVGLVLAVATWQIGLRNSNPTPQQEKPVSLVGDRPLPVQSWAHPAAEAKPTAPPPPKAVEPPPPPPVDSAPSSASSSDSSPEPLEAPARKFARGYSEDTSR